MLDRCGGEAPLLSQSEVLPVPQQGLQVPLSVGLRATGNTFPAITQREKGWSWFLFPHMQEGSSSTQLRTYFPGHPEKLEGPGKQNFGDPLLCRRAESGQERGIIPQAVTSRCRVCSPFLFAPSLQGAACVSPRNTIHRQGI